MKTGGLTFSITGMPVVQELCQTLIDVSKDERIPLTVRDELCDKVNKILVGR
jgi:hypothetical protein